MTHTTTTPEIMKQVLNVVELTSEEIRSENREYNPREWDNVINRYLKYSDVKFYKAEPQRGYAYARYYAVYTIEEGITLMNDVSYSSSLSNGGFAQVIIVAGTQIFRKLLRDVNGNYGYGGTDKANRAIMARNSKNHGTIFSKCF